VRDPYEDERLADNGDVRFAVATSRSMSVVGRWLAVGIVGSLLFGSLMKVLTDSADLAIGACAVTLLAGFAKTAIEHRRAQRAIVAEEMNRLAHLPFEVRGFFENLALPPRSSCWVRVRLELPEEAPLPDAVSLGKLLERVSGRAVKRWDTFVQFDGPELDCSQNDGPDTNLALYTWQSKLLSEVLLPTHADHPLRTVELSRKSS
jgi:hypothetical protein